MPGHPPIDPEIAAVLADPDQPAASLRPADIPDARRRSAAEGRSVEELRRGGAIAVGEERIDGPGGEAIELLVLRPAAGGRAGPGLVYLHGGGMILGTRFTIDPCVLDLVERGTTVVSPDYPLAPENPYPAAHDSCFAAWCQVAGHADRYGIDPGRLAIAGSSAGGGLAAGVVLRARDEGVTLPSHQVLLCPMLDDREITASARELVGEGRWDRIANRTGWDAYLGDRRGGTEVPVYAAPARATDLAGLPPTFIDVGDVDTFRDEDIDYAARLSRAGVPVELHVWPGAAHGFTGFAPDAAISRAATDARLRYFARVGLTG